MEAIGELLMANHGYIHTKRTITSEQLGQLLREVNGEKFRGCLTIKEYSDTDLGFDGKLFEIEVEEGHERQWWLRSKTTIEHRHGMGDLAWWIDVVFSNMIAAKTDGKISDDGCDGKWQGEPDKYPTFKSWLEAMWGIGQKSPYPGYKFIARRYINAAIRHWRKRRPDLANLMG